MLMKQTKLHWLLWHLLTWSKSPLSVHQLFQPARIYSSLQGHKKIWVSLGDLLRFRGLPWAPSDLPGPSSIVMIAPTLRFPLRCLVFFFSLRSNVLSGYTLGNSALVLNLQTWLRFLCLYLLENNRKERPSHRVLSETLLNISMFKSCVPALLLCLFPSFSPAYSM